MFGWLKTNSPIVSSSVNPYVPAPSVNTKNVDEEYKQYAAATKLVPGCRVFARHRFSCLVRSSSKASGSILQVSSCSYIPIIVPVGMPASTFELPSSGSKTATYFSPSSIRTFLVLGSLGIKSTGVSSSSEAKTPRRPVKRSARFKISLAITSNFYQTVRPLIPKLFKQNGDEFFITKHTFWSSP